MAEQTVFRVRDYKRNKIFFFEKKPQVRKYFLENSHYDEIIVEEITWRYKHQLISLLNESVNQGLAIGLFGKIRDDDNQSPSDEGVTITEV